MTRLVIPAVALLRKSFRLESRFEFAQGLRAAIGISIPAGMGLILNQLPGAMIVTLATWFVLLSDVGGAYRQKALAMFSATMAIALAVVIASHLQNSVVTLAATSGCYKKLAELLELAFSVTPDEYADATSLIDRFPTSYEALLAAVENARQNWTAVRVRRAGPSARSMQLLTLIENAAQLGNVAVVLHEQKLLVSNHPRFQSVNEPLENLRVTMGRLTREIAAAIDRGGACLSEASKRASPHAGRNGTNLDGRQLCAAIYADPDGPG